MSSVVEGITSIPGLIGSAISNAVISIVDGIGNFFSTLWEWLMKLWDSIKAIPGEIGNLVLEGIKAIFLPDSGYIEDAYFAFVDELKFKFNLDTTVFENLFDNERAVEDVTAAYTIPGIGSFNFKFLDTSFLKDGVSYFRPFIRGFLILLMLLFHVKQLIGFFGYNAGVIAGRSDDIADSKKAQRGG